MKHHLSALKGSSVIGRQASLSSDSFRMKTWRARSVSGSFQEVRFSFLRLQRCLCPCVLRLRTSSTSSSFRHLRYGSRQKLSPCREAWSQTCCIPGQEWELHHVSTQVGEHRHPQLRAAHLLSQIQEGQTVVWPELICQSRQAPWEEGLSQEIAADLQGQEDVENKRWYIGFVDEPQHIET